MAKLTVLKLMIRGELGEELNEDIAYRIGRAYGEFLKPKRSWWAAMSVWRVPEAGAAKPDGCGTDVLDIGLSGTEEIYFATFHLGWTAELK
jgi:phosphomannomutase